MSSYTHAIIWCLSLPDTVFICVITTSMITGMWHNSASSQLPVMLTIHLSNSQHSEAFNSWLIESQPVASLCLHIIMQAMRKSWDMNLQLLAYMLTQHYKTLKWTHASDMPMQRSLSCLCVDIIPAWMQIHDISARVLQALFLSKPAQ